MNAIEILTVILSVFAIWFALTRSSSVPRQLWLTPAAALGCAIMVLGVAGTTMKYVGVTRATIGTSEASQRAAFDALLPWVAVRPMIIGMLGVFFFVAMLRSASLGDTGKSAALGTAFAYAMVICTAITLALATVYHLGFILEWQAVFQARTMNRTLIAAGATLVLCAVGGVSTFLRSTSWTPTEQTPQRA